MLTGRTLNPDDITCVLEPLVYRLEVAIATHGLLAVGVHHGEARHIAMAMLMLGEDGSPAHGGATDHERATAFVCSIPAALERAEHERTAAAVADWDREYVNQLVASRKKSKRRGLAAVPRRRDVKA